MRVKHGRKVEQAFALGKDDPGRAVELAQSVLDAADATAVERVNAQWARGLARRERGELAAGADDLFAARQAAVALGDPTLAARVDISLALVALFTGSVDGALEVLAQAEGHLTGTDLARLETQRGLVFHRSGDLARAELHYLSAERRLAGGDDKIASALLLLNLGILHAERGDLARSVRRLTEAADVAAAVGQRLLTAGARHNLGYARSRAGRMSEALEDLRAAAVSYREIGREDFVAIAEADAAEVLMRCNLVAEAARAADEALAGVRRRGNETDLADTALLAARCHLAAGHLGPARAAAEQSTTLLARQRRAASLVLAEHLRADLDAEERPGVASAAALRDVAGRLEGYGWTSEAAAARVRAGQLMIAAGEVDQAATILDRLRVVRDRPAGERAAAYLARGMLAEARGDRRHARTAIRGGLRVVAENQSSLTAHEFRTFAAGHGEALVELAARMAIADRRPRELLDRVEATRRMLWLAPRATPPSDEVLAHLLADLRVVSEDLRAAIGGGRDQGGQAVLRQRQLDLERDIRDHNRRGQAGGDAVDLRVGDAVAALGEHVLLEYAIVDGVLHAVSVAAGRARLHDLGSMKGVGDDIDACTFALHRLNREQGSARSKDAALTTLDALGRELASRLIPDRVLRSERPLLVVPAGALHGLAWGALPGLRSRAVSVSPSLVGWAVARQLGGDGPVRARAVTLVAGPGLPGATDEVESIAHRYRRPTVLVGERATAAATLDAMGHSRLVHLACHGAFRSDNPLFSTLSLADGPLTVYDLERCRTMPRTIVLSACNVATSSVLRGGTLLGLASALMTFGAATVIAPLTPVNDERVVEVMMRLHGALAGGESPAAALVAARATADEAPEPTGAAFIAIGV